jgi:fumarylacetoacetase
MTDQTHDRSLRSWVEGADGHPEFPIQNLPFGVFSPPGGSPRGGVAIGGAILDIPAALASGVLDGPDAEAAAGPVLNPLLALPAPRRAALRGRISACLSASAPARLRDKAAGLLHDAASCTLHLPAAIGDYTDFYAGIQHATNVGRLLRAEVPLQPNYKYVPVGYHGRASSVCASDVPVRRPNGQRKRAAEMQPSFGPSRNLDYELELGIWVGKGNPLGQPIPIGEAAEHIAGYCLLNDWSARDLQGWESQPLGPSLAKSFHTTISPWIVTSEALAPFRRRQAPRPEGDPAPLAYLLDAADQAQGALGITLEVLITTQAMRAAGMAPHRLSIGDSSHLYWTPAQLLAHHASAGCNLRPGDLFGSGTVSSPEESGWGSMLELSQAGRRPVALPTGETRRFLEDGDEITLRGRCARAGFAPIGFGACRGTVVAAP